VSVAFMTVAILSDPMLVSEDGGVMFHRLERGGDRNGPLPLTVFHWFWHDHRAPLFVIGAVVLALVAVVYAPIARRLTRRKFVLGLVALGAWRILYAGGTVIERAPHGWPVALALLLALAATIALLIRGERWAFAPALLLVPAGWPRFTAHTLACIAPRQRRTRGTRRSRGSIATSSVASSTVSSALRTTSSTMSPRSMCSTTSR